MSKIAQDYIDTKTTRKLAESAFEAALVKQFGSFWKGMAAGKSQHNEETAKAFKVMSDAIDAACRARGVANANGGDFALFI